VKYKFNIFTGNFDLVASSTSGGVQGPSSSTDNAITRWDGITGQLVQNSKALLQDDGAIQAQGFITNRQVTGTVVVGATESWIAPSLELQPGSVIVLGAGAQLIII
jgi:hypothetical protein